MTRRAIVLITGAIVLVAGTLLFSESPATSPGALSEVHADLDLSCRACHTPFRGARAGCADCHGGLPPVNAHADLGLDCGGCHREHEGLAATLVAHAGDDCTTCHAHSSIETVARHRMEVIDRPLEVTRYELRFSHRFHLEEIEDAELAEESQDCQGCHLVEAARGTSKHSLRWTGCEPCHDDWHDAGFGDLPNAPRDAEVLVFATFIEPARLSRVRFSHSPGHLQTPCGGCHVQMAVAEEILVAGKVAAAVVVAAKQIRNCFSCHTHGPDAAASDDPLVTGPLRAVRAVETRITACAECHEFHGLGASGDFPAGASDDPGPEPWDVWARIGSLSVTPWLLAFLSIGVVGYVALVRRLPKDGLDPLEADPDVAPQRVSEVPALSPSGECSVASLFIVGELASVPLINRAMKSGFDAIDFIANRLEIEGRSQDGDVVDVLIAGAGPAGLGAATKAKSLGLSYVLCEKSTAAATIKNYPRAKIVQAAPIDVPEYGTFFQEDDESKEGLVRRWEDIVARTGVVVNEREEVVDIKVDSEGVLTTEVQGGTTYRSRFVVLAIGVRGTPRRIGLPGEEPERVAYILIDAEDYRERQVLVVGGGNAACEAALALAAPELLNHVTLSHRGPVLKGVTAQNSQDVDNAAREGLLQMVPDSALKEIRETTVVLHTPGGDQEIANDSILALIGAELPTKFLRVIGVKLIRKGGL